MPPKSFFSISLWLFSIIIIVVAIRNFSRIYATQIYHYGPCVESQAMALTQETSPTPTLAAYPALPHEDIAALAYPAPALPTATPVICSCQNNWETASFSVLNLHYPQEALIHMDSDSIFLKIPTCSGDSYPASLTIRIVDNDKNLDAIEFVNQSYAKTKDLRYREIVISGSKVVEVYQAGFSKDRKVYLQHHNKFIIATLQMSVGKTVMPDGDGNIYWPTPSPEMLGFYYMVLNTIEFLD